MRHWSQELGSTWGMSSRLGTPHTHTRTIEIDADKDTLALELGLAGQALEGFLACVLLCA
jgi:hypothetical protein